MGEQLNNSTGPFLHGSGWKIVRFQVATGQGNHRNSLLCVKLHALLSRKEYPLVIQHSNWKWHIYSGFASSIWWCSMVFFVCLPEITRGSSQIPFNFLAPLSPRRIKGSNSVCPSGLSVVFSSKCWGMGVQTSAFWRGVWRVSLMVCELERIASLLQFYHRRSCENEPFCTFFCWISSGYIWVSSQ